MSLPLNLKYVYNKTDAKGIVGWGEPDIDYMHLLIIKMCLDLDQVDTASTYDLAPDHVPTLPWLYQQLFQSSQP